MSRYTRLLTMCIGITLGALGTLGRADAEAPRGRFASPRRITGAIDVGKGGPITLSDDGRTMVFAAIREGDPDYQGSDQDNGGDLYIAWRADDADEFRQDMHLGLEINSPTDELGAALSSDGLILVYSSRRSGNSDLWVASREAQFDENGRPLLFENARILDPGLVPLGHYCWDATFSDDDSRLYLTSFDLATDTNRLFVVDVARSGTELSLDLESLELVCGEGVNTPANESSASLAAGGRALFFAETLAPYRPGTRGFTDIWFAWRDYPETCFETVANLNELYGTAINTSEGEWSPYMTRDWPAEGSKLYYCIWREIYVAEWIPAPPRVERTRYVRGDANDDGAVDVSDAQFILSWLFTGGPGSSCELSCDVNDDDAIELSDAVYALNFLFIGGPTIPAPFPECGEAPLENILIPGDALGCELSSSCE